MNTAESRAEAACVTGGTELHLAARTGDVARAAYLLEVCDADVNAYDRWNATPLFYASLCGHVNVLRVLLQAGASCERNTFEGERVLYAALNDTVRSVLLNEGFAFAASRGHDAFLDHLENAHDEQQSAHATYRDLRFTVADDAAADSSDGCAVLEAHACVLAARCPYLARRFRGQREMRLTRARFPASALTSLLRWCYTARLDVRREDLEPTLKLLAQCGLDVPLGSQLRQQAERQPEGQQRLVVEPASAAVAKVELSAAFRQLYSACSDETCDGLDGDTLALLRTGACEFHVDNRVFYAHPSFLGPRSEFFHALFSRWESPTQQGGGGSMGPVPLSDVSHTAFSSILRWAFTDEVEAPREEVEGQDDNDDVQSRAGHLAELVQLADLFLLDALKQRAATLLAPFVGAHSCVSLLRLGEQCGADRLSAAAAACVAEHLLDLADDEELQACVRESAALIRGRQATDSIPVVDDIAFQVARLHGEGAADGLSDEDEEERWTMPPDADARHREELMASMRAEASSSRRRKVAVLTQLAARVQGWDVVAVRART